MGRPRALVMLIASIVVFGMLSAPAMAKPPAGSNPVAACSHGGFRTYTDSAGNPFTSMNECVRYAVRGGELIRVPILTVTFTDPVEGVFYVDVVGAGLKSGAIVYVNTDLGTKIDISMVDGAGNLTFRGGFYPCDTFAWFEYSTLHRNGAPIATRAATPC